jgi:simple sugar transport system substrate-binding protein
MAFFTACSQDAQDSANVGSTGAAGTADAAITVGFSQVGSESGWRTSFSESVKAEAARRGIDLKFSDAQQKQENQIRAIRSFIAQGVDAILVAPVVETGWQPVLEEAKRASIPVVIVDRNMALSDDSLYLTRVASDFVEEGRKAARWLMEATGGSCAIVELQGTVGATAAIDRKKGFDGVIANYPDARIVRSQTAEFTRSKGKEVM